MFGVQAVSCLLAHGLRHRGFGASGCFARCEGHLKATFKTFHLRRAEGSLKVSAAMPLEFRILRGKRDRGHIPQSV